MTTAASEERWDRIANKHGYGTKQMPAAVVLYQAAINRSSATHPKIFGHGRDWQRSFYGYDNFAWPKDNND